VILNTNCPTSDMARIDAPHEFGLGNVSCCYC
jgi:hypothetical protein